MARKCSSSSLSFFAMPAILREQRLRLHTVERVIWMLGHNALLAALQKFFAPWAVKSFHFSFVLRRKCAKFAKKNFIDINLCALSVFAWVNFFYIRVGTSIPSSDMAWRIICPANPESFNLKNDSEIFSSSAMVCR